MTADLPDFPVADADLADILADMADMVDIADISVVSVSGLTTYIQAVLQADSDLRQVWVMGEVSRLAIIRVGYFLICKIRGLLFAVWLGIVSG